MQLIDRDEVTQLNALRACDWGCIHDNVVEGGQSRKDSSHCLIVWVSLYFWLCIKSSAAEQKFVEHETLDFVLCTRGAELATCTPYTKLHSGLLSLILQKLVVFLSMADLKLEVLLAKLERGRKEGSQKLTLDRPRFNKIPRSTISTNRVWVLLPSSESSICILT